MEKWMWEIPLLRWEKEWNWIVGERETKGRKLEVISISFSEKLLHPYIPLVCENSL